MSFVLNNDKRYSALERKVFALLPQGAGKSAVTSNMLAFSVFGRKRLNGRQIVVGCLSKLAKKISTNREPFRIKKTQRNGPHPIEWWTEGRF